MDIAVVVYMREEVCRARGRRREDGEITIGLRAALELQRYQQTVLTFLMERRSGRGRFQ